MSHGLRTIVDRREKMRLRFARLSLFVFISLCYEMRLRATGSGGDEAVVRFAHRPGEGDRPASFEGYETNSTRLVGGQIFSRKVMHSAANRLADFKGRHRVNSATETQIPTAKAGTPRHWSGRIIFRYGLAVGSVAAATALGLLADQLDLHESVFTFFVLAVALTSWYGGVWPAIIAFGFGALAFNYCFTPPSHSISFTREDFAYLSVFALFSGLLIWFGIVRRRVETALRQSRDELEIKIAQRTAELRKTNEQLQLEVAERRRAEEILRERASLLDLTRDTIFVRNMNDVITYWNRGAEELYGWTGQEAVGKVSHQLTRTSFPEPLNEINTKLLRTGCWEGELIHTTREGTRVVVASRWSLQRDERGNPTAILETNNNITERKEAQEALRRSRDELEIKVKERTAELRKTNVDLQSVNEELEAFAYSVSHDLRAPVRHIAGFTELLQKHSDAVLDDQSRHHISMILDSAKRMGTLVDDLLAFSRIGRAETQKTTVHLEQLIKGVVGELAPEAQGRNIAWRIGTLPICYGDPSMLRMVFANLVTNAVKFTRSREQAEIEIGSLNHKPDEVVVFVKDNGVGFDMKYMDKLFGVFQRLHSQEAFEGTGIGLATVQRIVQGHGGRVWAEASVNKGATFYVVLPKAGKANA
jgi:PAS domain S-box-containing protein